MFEQACCRLADAGTYTVDMQGGQITRIVDGHGGEISVAPRPGGGTVVQLRFPVALRAPGPVETKGGMG